MQLAAVALSFILIALLVVTSSRAAFVAQSENVTNQVTAAAVDLTDNDSGTAMFTSVPTMVPLTNVDRCIDVTYTGSVDPAMVMLYINAPPTGGLAPFLNLTIDIGADTNDAFRTCNTFVASANVYTGTLADFATNRTSYANGVATWDPGPGTETRTFRFRVAVQNDPLAEGLSSTFGFSWETKTA